MGSRGRPLTRLTERRGSEAEALYQRKILDSLDPDPSVIVLDVGCDDGALIDPNHPHFSAVAVRRSPTRQDTPATAPALRSR
jgi:hypothetical protein